MSNIIKKINGVKETIKIKIRRKYIQTTAKFRRKKIKFDDFTIISNNCWAGLVYKSYGLKYNTPTVGLFFVSDDYIKFISNIKHYMSIDNIKNVNPKESKWYEQLKTISKYGQYPIGKIDDIEIHFLHYSSIEEAINKWNKRKQRINYNKILYKYSEMNLCTEKNIEEFQRLEQKNKICFVSEKYKEMLDKDTYIVSNERKTQISASEEPIGNSKIVNINNIINNL